MLHEILNDSTPYTYRIKCEPVNQYYYGVRYGKGCDPSDLWNTYFTSSNAVKQLIVEHVIAAFSYEIRKTFTSRTRAIEWESTVLRRISAASNTNYINMNNANGKFHPPVTLTEVTKGRMSKARLGFKCSEEARLNMSKARVGLKLTDDAKARRKISMQNYVISDETKAKLSAIRIGTKSSEETKAKISNSQKIRLANKKLLNSTTQIISTK